MLEVVRGVDPATKLAHEAAQEREEVTKQEGETIDNLIEEFTVKHVSKKRKTRASSTRTS
jgi:hypothetical protein